MPRYYFHIRQGDELVEDEEGMDADDLEAAKAEATASARELAIEEIRNNHRVGGRSVEVADAEGRTLAVVAVRDAIG